MPSTPLLCRFKSVRNVSMSSKISRKPLRIPDVCFSTSASSSESDIGSVLTCWSIGMMTAASSDDGLLNTHEFDLPGRTDERACTIVMTVREISAESCIFGILRGDAMTVFVVPCERTGGGRFLGDGCLTSLPAGGVCRFVALVAIMTGWPFCGDCIKDGEMNMLPA